MEQSLRLNLTEKPFSVGGEAKDKYCSMEILIADDHPLVRSAIQNVIQKLDDDIQIFEATNFIETMLMVEDNPSLNLLLLDLDMPGMDWFEALSLLRTNYTKLPIIILSASQNPSDVSHALSLNVQGYIPKTLEPNVMVQALRIVLAGGQYVPPYLMNTNTHQPVEISDKRTETPNKNSEFVLTKRQKDVLRLIMDGKSNKETARILNLSDSTVKVHVAAILRTLNVHSRTQAVLVAERSNIFNAE
jgi:DNA-binding NarL/FixJ family response regulator